MLGRYTFFSRANQIDRQEPLGKRQMGIVKDGPGSHGVLIMTVFALVKVANLLCFPQGLKLHYSGATALDTHRTIRPANVLKVLNALFFGVEAFDNLENRRGLVHG